jgi:hypothetical protein
MDMSSHSEWKNQYTLSSIVETEYIHPEKMKYHDWTGGDAEKGKWFFKTIGTGTTSLVVSLFDSPNKGVTS